MRRIMLCAGLGAMAASAAQAETAGSICVRGEDERSILVRVPGEVGAVCDVRYVRNAGADVSVPYHADNDADFCSERARALAASLAAAGFECAEIVAGGAETLPEEASTVDAAPSEQSLGETSLLAESSPPDEPATIVTPREPLSTPQEVDTQIFRAPPPPIDDGAVDDIPTAQLADQPALAAGDDKQAHSPRVEAVRGPTPLTPTPAAVSAEQARSAPSESSGKLVGAIPEESHVAPAIAPEAVEPRYGDGARALPETAPTAARPTGAKVAPTAPPASGRPPLGGQRAAPDVIRATLEAQAAAWNDGDFDAFMNSYWNSPDLRFVSGSTVSKGWAATLKRYRERYGQGGSLGYLSFDNLDVQMIEDDVAIVVGRFLLERAEGNSSGAFTLVMRRIDGAWRIVHDHTVADAPPASVAIKD